MTSNCVITGENKALDEIVTVMLMCLPDTTCPIKSGFSLVVCIRVYLCVYTCIHLHIANQIKASTVDYWLLSQCICFLFPQ